MGPLPQSGDFIIARGRFIRREQDTSKNLRINERIRISPVRLIDADNNQVGIIDTHEAQSMARQAGLDLVEVAPGARPPVCRIMDYGKWKYQQRKKEAKAKAHSKQSELKEVRLRPSTDSHDMDIKSSRAREFLSEGHKVQFTLMFKGRQMAHRNIGFNRFREIASEFEDVAKVEVPPRSMGRRMTMILAPIGKQAQQSKPKGDGDAKAKPAAPKAPAPAPAQAAAPSPAPSRQAAG
jgi:translation initiation factor IF-3